MITAVFITILLASCASRENKPAENLQPTKPDTLQHTPGKPSPAKCYQYASVDDTIRLTVIQLDSLITGTLSYRLKEKDKNDGAIQGKMVAGMLIADYTFMSEGVSSVRQVVFRLDGGAFVEGYGPIVTQNGRVYFKDIKSLNYDTNMKLEEYTCR